MPSIRRPRSAHVELAHRILEIARREGMQPGDRLPEQHLADLCDVSRTPVRAALRLLCEQGAVERTASEGFRLVVDPASRPDAAPALPSSEADVLAEAILRDRSARRLDETVTAGALMKRYGAERRAVLNALTILSEDQLVERAPGQCWKFRPAPDGPDGLADSYEFRLLMEPAAVLAPGFRLDAGLAAALRSGMEALAAMSDDAFDLRAFQRLDGEFHTMIARGTPNRFLADALAAHLRLRRLPGAIAGVNIYRLRQATGEHLGILDQLERRQNEVAADLLRAHLRLSRSQRPQAANRGVPALLGTIARPA